MVLFLFHFQVTAGHFRLVQDVRVYGGTVRRALLASSAQPARSKRNWRLLPFMLPVGKGTSTTADSTKTLPFSWCVLPVESVVDAVVHPAYVASLLARSHTTVASHPWLS
jgi:hypothetical protein